MQFSFRGEKTWAGDTPRLGVAGRFYSIITRNKPNDNFSLSRSGFSSNTKNRGTSGTSGFLLTIESYIMVSAA